jgi:hypothetical protein
MTMRPRLLLLIAALCAGVLVSACGTSPADDGTDPGPPEPPRGARDMVLRMTYSPGFAQVAEHATLPAFSLYGDGRIIIAETSPGAPARPGGWQRARELRTDRAGIDRLLRAARAAGLDRAPSTPVSPSSNPAPDASSAHVTLRDKDGRRHVIKLASPEAATGAEGELYQALSDPAAWLGGGLRPAPYTYTALAVLRRDESSPTSGAHRWPLDSLAFTGTRLGTGQNALTCTVLRGDEATQLTAGAAGAPQSAQWTDGTRHATLELRPLLPDEDDCQDLASPIG